jgi:hypothetical protein
MGKQLLIFCLLLLSLHSRAQTDPGAQRSSPLQLPGTGLAQHDFFYAGEGPDLKMFIVKKGKVVWTYTHPGPGEISDAVMLSNGNILFAHQFGVTEISPDKKVIWNHDASAGFEIHTA